MAQIWSRPEIKLKIALELDEVEARALGAIFGYDIESFLKVFYETMGKAYLEPHESGLRSLFATARQPISLWLKRVDVARKAFEANKEG